MDRIYPTELQLNRANSSDTEAHFLDLDLCISYGAVSTKKYDKQDDFDFDVVNFPFLDGDVPRRTSYAVHISQIIRFARASSILVGSTKTYERISTDERSIVNTHSIDITAKFAVSIKENQDRLPMLKWLPKLHKRPYKARFIANSSSCTTTVLSKLLTLCLTAVKKHWIRYYDTVYERDGINYFWSIKNSNDVLNKF